MDRTSWKEKCDIKKEKLICISVHVPMCMHYSQGTSPFGYSACEDACLHCFECEAGSATAATLMPLLVLWGIETSTD